MQGSKKLPCIFFEKVLQLYFLNVMLIYIRLYNGEKVK